MYFVIFFKNSVQVFSCVQSNFRVVLVQPIFFSFVFCSKPFCVRYYLIKKNSSRPFRAIVFKILHIFYSGNVSYNVVKACWPTPFSWASKIVYCIKHKCPQAHVEAQIGDIGGETLTCEYVQAQNLIKSNICEGLLADKCIFFCLNFTPMFRQFEKRLNISIQVQCVQEVQPFQLTCLESKNWNV
jgi:hypothetical protein